MNRNLACLTLLGAFLTATGTLAQGAPTGSSQAPTGYSQAPSSYGEASQPPPEPPGLVRRYAVGPRFTIAPGVFIPSSGSAGFSLGLEGAYGFDLGPVIVAPGLAFQGNWGGDFTAYTGLATFRVTLPLGNFGPFVEGGVGYGHVGGPLDYSSGGFAVRGGAGFIFFFSPNFALGLSVRYDAIIDTPFKGWTFAPLILLAF